MIAIIMPVLILGFVYSLWRALPFAMTQRRGWAGVWRLACVIAAVRVGVFAMGVLWMRSPDWMQNAGYGMSLVGLPEIYVAKGLRHEASAWLAVSCGLLIASSFLWASIFRSRSQKPNSSHTSG